MEYALKNVKTFKGMEGCGGFNASLYKDGKKVADVVDDDSGGPILFHFTERNDREDYTSFVSERTYFCNYSKERVSHNVDTYTATMVSVFLLKKRITIALKKNKMVFFHDGNMLAVEKDENHLQKQQEYLGKRYHGAVFLTQENQENLDEFCRNVIDAA